MGISPLRLVDYDILEVENLIRHPLRPPSLDQYKASSLARQIHRDVPWCEAEGIDVNFLELSEDRQLQLISEADVVVVAADPDDCRRRVNQLCIRAEVPAVYPAVWVSDDIHDAEVGEIYWTLPGRHTPCYACWLESRGEEDHGEDGTGHGTRADIKIIALVAALVVRTLLSQERSRIRVLDPRQNLILVHGFMPTSRVVQGTFGAPGLRSRNVAVPFPLTPCRECDGHQPVPAASTNGLGSLREAGLSIGNRQRERADELARREATRQAEENRRNSLLDSARDQFGSISTALKDAILSAAPAATCRVQPKDQYGHTAWEIKLDYALLSMSNPQRIIYDSGGPEPLPDREWSVSANYPFDVIAYCDLVVGGRRNSQSYVGRGHALWFCDAQSPGHYAWFETAFVEADRRHHIEYNLFYTSHQEDDRKGFYVPVPKLPGSTGVSSALEKRPGPWEVAWPFTMLTVGYLDDFIDRWAGWLATAAQDRLQLPSQLPEHDPIGTWRTGGF